MKLSMKQRVCEKCGKPTELMYKTDKEHPICVDCLEKILRDMITTSPRYNKDIGNPPAPQLAETFIYLDEAISINLEFAEIRIQNIGIQHRFQDLHQPMFICSVRSLYNNQSHFFPYIPIYRDAIIPIAFGYLRDTVFKDNKYMEDMV